MRLSRGPREQLASLPGQRYNLLPLVVGLMFLLAGFGTVNAQQSPAVGNVFRTLELNALYSNPYGEFSETVPNASSGFSKAGGGFSAAATTQRIGPMFNFGAGIEISAYWQQVHHLALQQELEAAFATPQAYGTNFLLEQRNWKLLTFSLGPIVGYRIKKATVEGRLMVCLMTTGNPYYITDLGTYIPPGWEKFFYSGDTKTGRDISNPRLAIAPKLGLHLPVGEQVILQLNGSMLFSKLQQEMEIIDTRIQSGVVIFDRRQATFSQKVRLGSVGAGVAVRFY